LRPLRESQSRGAFSKLKEEQKNKNKKNKEKEE
jgi:hypothetical protein